MKGLKTTIVANSATPPPHSKKLNNPKILLSSIAIAVLYSTSFADGKSHCQMTNNNKTCIISDKNTTNTIILFHKTGQTTEVTG